MHARRRRDLTSGELPPVRLGKQHVAPGGALMSWTPCAAPCPAVSNIQVVQEQEPAGPSGRQRGAAAELADAPILRRGDGRTGGAVSQACSSTCVFSPCRAF